MTSRAATSPDLSPPWVLFLAERKPHSILPAGRLGDVADVRGLPIALVEAVIAAANRGVFWDPVAVAKELEGVASRLRAAPAPMPLDDIAILACAALPGPVDLTATIRRLVETGLLTWDGQPTEAGRERLAGLMSRDVMEEAGR